MKKIITHINPDLDAVASVWLIKRFLPGWQEAAVDFVAAEKIKGVDDDPDVLYVDVGWGKLDHHQTGQPTSAAKLCWQYLSKKRDFSEVEAKAIKELVTVVTQVDNAGELYWSEVRKPRFYFYLQAILSNLRGLARTDKQVLNFGMEALEAVLLGLKNRLTVQTEFSQGIKFELPGGWRGVAVTTSNERILWEGEARGYAVVVRQDPKSGGVRVYCRPDNDIDLTKVYNKVRQLDPQSDWFLHASKKLLLNESRVNPKMQPTKLSLEEIIEILKLEIRN